MAFPVTKSFVSKILPLTPFSGKIWREFPATTMIPQDRGGGGYIELQTVFALIDGHSGSKLTRASRNDDRTHTEASRAMAGTISTNTKTCDFASRLVPLRS